MTRITMSNRRSFLKNSTVGGIAVAVTASGLQGSAEVEPKYPLRVSACCSSLRLRAKVEAIEAGYRAGLDGVSVRFLTDSQNPESLRHRKVQLAFRDASLQYGIQINSLLGGGSPKGNPSAMVAMLETIECARNLGANVVLLALLRRGFPVTDEEYEEVIAALKELAPHAAEEGIVLGLECSGSAKDQLRIIEGVNHSAVQIYYDVYNAMHFGFAPLDEIPLLGDVVCEYHIKNGRNLMRTNIEGRDHPRIEGQKIERFNHSALAAAIKKTGYKGWLTLETSSVSDDPVQDMRDNVAYVRDVYQMPEA